MAIKRASTRKRLVYIDVLSVAAALSVVALHCNGCYWEGPSQGRSWMSANFIETFLYWPVPVFFMISGATLMDYRKRMDTREYLIRRFTRTVIPWLVWSLVSFGYCVFMAHVAGDAMPDLSPAAVVSGFLNEKYLHVYWFFPPLFACYLSMPLFSAVNVEIRNKVFGLMVAIGAVSVSILPLACTLLEVTWNTAFVPPPVTGYAMYVLLGYLLSQWEPTREQRLIVYACAIAGWLMHMLGTDVIARETGNVVGTFKGYTNLPALMQSIGVFVLFKHLNYESEGGWLARIGRLCGRLSSLTFGIYLTHQYLINIALRLFGINWRSIVWRTAGTVVVFGIAALITWAMKKVPLVNRAIP